MDREILFRGKSLKTGKWTQGYLFCCWEQAYILWGMVNDNPDMVEVDTETVCRYTGLADKNGRKIFEGDIIQYNKKLFKIVWVQECAHFAAHPMEGLSWSPCMNVGTVRTAEVVGNIFDNPDLIGGVE